MKKTTISVAVEQEKLRAIQFYMERVRPPWRRSWANLWPNFIKDMCHPRPENTSRAWMIQRTDPGPDPIGSPNLLARMRARRVSNGEFYLC